MSTYGFLHHLIFRPNWAFMIEFFQCPSLSSWSSSFFSPDPLGIIQANFARKPNVIKHDPTHSLVKWIQVYLNKDHTLFKAR